PAGGVSRDGSERERLARPHWQSEKALDVIGGQRDHAPLRVGEIADRLQVDRAASGRWDERQRSGELREGLAVLVMLGKPVSRPGRTLGRVECFEPLERWLEALGAQRGGAIGGHHGEDKHAQVPGGPGKDPTEAPVAERPEPLTEAEIEAVVDYVLRSEGRLHGPDD